MCITFVPYILPGYLLSPARGNCAIIELRQSLHGVLLPSIHTRAVDKRGSRVPTVAQQLLNWYDIEFAGVVGRYLSWLQLRIRRSGASSGGTAQKFPRLDPLLLQHGSGPTGKWGE